MAKKKKKTQTLEEVEKDVMGDFPDTDKIDDGEKVSNDEKPNDEKVKKTSGKKQDELPGMPEKTPLEKQADKVIETWEDLKTIQDSLIEEKNQLLPLMKKENRSILNLKDSKGNSLEIKITTTNEKLSINKKKEINL